MCVFSPSLLSFIHCMVLVISRSFIVISLFSDPGSCTFFRGSNFGYPSSGVLTWTWITFPCALSRSKRCEAVLGTKQHEFIALQEWICGKNKYQTPVHLTLSIAEITYKSSVCKAPPNPSHSPRTCDLRLSDRHLHEHEHWKHVDGEWFNDTVAHDMLRCYMFDTMYNIHQYTV